MNQIDQDIKAQMDAIRHQFPTERALLLPLLHAMQRKTGWISPDDMVAAAEYLHLPLSHVEETATFYTMYNKKPIGKHHVMVCTNLSCWLNGADELKECLEKRLGIHEGQTTADGKFTLTEVECLASCGTAPVVQINDIYHESVTQKSMLAMVDKLERGEALI